jgi:transcription factor E2F7/8
MRKEKSLEVLSIGFLKLFIHWRKALSLEEAAKKLVG